LRTVLWEDKGMEHLSWKGAQSMAYDYEKERREAIAAGNEALADLWMGQGTVPCPTDNARDKNYVGQGTVPCPYYSSPSIREMLLSARRMR